MRSSAPLELYRTSNGAKLLSIFPPSDMQIGQNHVQFSKDGQYVATFRSDPGSNIANFVVPVLIYRVSDGALVNRLDLKIPGTNNSFGIIALSPDLSIVAAGIAYDNNNQGVSLYRVSDGALISRYPNNRFPVAFSPDSTAFVSGIAGPYSGQVSVKVELRDIQTGQSRWAVDNYTYGLAFSPDGTTVAQYDGGKINLLRASNGALQRSITSTIVYGYPYLSDITGSIGFLPNGALFAITPDNTIKAWDTASGTQLRSYKPDGIGATKNGIAYLSLAPNGQYFRLCHRPKFGECGKGPVLWARCANRGRRACCR